MKLTLLVFVMFILPGLVACRENAQGGTSEKPAVLISSRVTDCLEKQLRLLSAQAQSRAEFINRLNSNYQECKANRGELKAYAAKVLKNDPDLLLTLNNEDN